MGFLRGQSGIEYLSNYSIAAVVVLIILGALVYLGVFNFSQPDVCIFQKGLSCETHYLKQGQSVATLSIKNQLDDAIVISDVLCSGEVPNPATALPNRAWNSFEGAGNEPKVKAQSAGEISLPQPTGKQPVVLASESFDLKVFCYSENGQGMGTLTGADRFKGIVFIRYRLNSSPAVPGSNFFHVIQGNLQGRMN